MSNLKTLSRSSALLQPQKKDTYMYKRWQMNEDKKLERIWIVERDVNTFTSFFSLNFSSISKINFFYLTLNNWQETLVV